MYKRQEFGCGEYASVESTLQLRRVERIGQVAGHQRRKVVPGGNGVNDTLAIGYRRFKDVYKRQAGFREITTGT